ncbi:hypothetical protein [Hydrocarboniphaga sp.]|uniref:hypothetical protein n=1 Tax=Hydrocarboniphaga sp. TaxID=2033016 RepID=UPI00260283CC|nr:hypothetical protein [Hydrocarboniphaga sp.]
MVFAPGGDNKKIARERRRDYLVDVLQRVGQHPAARVADIGANAQLTPRCEWGGSSKDDSSDLSYGLGGEMAVTDTLRVGADLIVLSTKGDTTIW